jgi:chromosome segregation ATPase
MLKSLRIINFESHKDTTINFTDGFNVIIGQSDGGKSSIIRAIAAVCYNMW